MNFKNFPVILACFLSITFLSACQNTSAPSNEQNPPLSNETSTQSNSEEKNMADQAAYKQAIQLRDSTFCDKIEDQNYKSECQKAIEDGKKFDEAITKLDPELCKSLSSEDQQKACQITIEGNQKEEENTKKREEEIKAMYDELNSIMATGDLTKCNTLTDQNLMNSCKYNIVTKEAIDKKDGSLCQKIETEEGKKECQNAVQSASAN